MSKWIKRWVLALAVAASGVGLSTYSPWHPAAPHAEPNKVQAAQGEANKELASVDDLKTEAMKALRAGQFDRTSELLGKAAGIAHDPMVSRMADWSNQFESQRSVFVAERRKQFDKAVGDVQKLLKANKDAYVIDYV